MARVEAIFAAGRGLGMLDDNQFIPAANVRQVGGERSSVGRVAGLIAVSVPSETLPVEAAAHSVADRLGKGDLDAADVDRLPRQPQNDRSLTLSAVR